MTINTGKQAIIAAYTYPPQDIAISKQPTVNFPLTDQLPYNNLLNAESLLKSDLYVESFSIVKHFLLY